LTEDDSEQQKNLVYALKLLQEEYKRVQAEGYVRV